MMKFTWLEKVLIGCFCLAVGWMVFNFFIPAYQSAKNSNEDELKAALNDFLPNEKTSVNLSKALEKLAGEKKKPIVHMPSNRAQLDLIKGSKLTDEETAGADKFFAQMMKVEGTKNLYENALKIYDGSTSGKAASRWIAMGLIMSSSKEFVASFDKAILEMNQDPESVAQTIQNKMEDIRKDPFIYQMTGNLLYKLNVSPEIKTEIYGREIEFQLKSAQGDKPNSSLWISLNNLTLFRQVGAEEQAMRQYFTEGLRDSKLSAETKEEVIEIANGFLPSLNL